MPTYDQANELINNTNHTYTTINGKYGMKFTSKTDTSKYIFLPAGGFWNSTSFYGAESEGQYRVTTWRSGFTEYYIIISSSFCSYNWDEAHHAGRSVRAIQ